MTPKKWALAVAAFITFMALLWRDRNKPDHLQDYTNETHGKKPW